MVAAIVVCLHIPGGDGMLMCTCLYGGLDIVQLALVVYFPSSN